MKFGQRIIILSVNTKGKHPIKMMIK